MLTPVVSDWSTSPSFLKMLLCSLAPKPQSSNMIDDDTATPPAHQKDQSALLNGYCYVDLAFESLT